MNTPEARTMTDQSAEPTPELWMLHDMEFATVVTAAKPGRFIALCDGKSFTREENARHARFIAAAPAMAAERDRLKMVNERLVTALQRCRALNHTCDEQDHCAMCIGITEALDEAAKP